MFPTLLRDLVNINGTKIPFVETAEHLGHTLHQLGTVDVDCKKATAKFMQKSAEQYFKAWNTCVKLIFKIPRSTYTLSCGRFLQ